MGDGDIDKARRSLLRAMVYVAPAVVSIVAIRSAHAQPAPSCGPAQCNPATGPCQPDNCRPAIP